MHSTPPKQRMVSLWCEASFINRYGHYSCTGHLACSQATGHNTNRRLTEDGESVISPKRKQWVCKWPILIFSPYDFLSAFEIYKLECNLN